MQSIINEALKNAEIEKEMIHSPINLRYQPKEKPQHRLEAAA